MPVALYRALSVLLVICLATALEAQSGKLAKANRKLEQGDVIRAIELYQEAIATTGDPAAILSLAEAYQRSNQPAQAETWYERALKYEGLMQPTHVLSYARVLQQSGKYSEAEAQFRIYQTLNPEDPAGAQGIASCQMARQLLTAPAPYQVTNLPLNSKAAEFGAFPYKGGVLFCSDQEGQRRNRNFLNLYECIHAGGKWMEKEPLHGIKQTKFHDGPAIISANGKELYFTRSNYEDDAFGGHSVKNEENVVILKLMIATYNEEKQRWNDPEELPFNSPEYSVAHPALSADGQILYFSSDRPGGQGGTDIWFCKRTNNGWSDPINLGASVNTPQDELFPTTTNNRQLYIASNGHPGLGGLDIYRIHLGENRSISAMENVGVPFNSSYDDFGLILTEEGQGYFNSNRPGGKGGDDIYYFEPTFATLVIKSSDVDSKKPIEDVAISISADGHDTKITDHSGMVSFSVKEKGTYLIEAERFDFFPKKRQYLVTQAKPGDTIWVDLDMKRAFDLVLKGNVVSQKSGAPLGSVEVILKDDNQRYEKCMTDNDGSFMVSLEPDRQYVIAAEHEGFVYSESKFSTSGLFGQRVIEQSLVLTELVEHEVITFEHINYEYNRAEISKDASKDLKKLLKILRTNPEVVVEISAHTDARGGFAYNETLSQRRAESVVDWLISRGIRPDRLIAMGYGEQKLVNDCGDGVPCPEARHRENRRSELKVLDVSVDKGTSVELSSTDDYLTAYKQTISPNKVEAIVEKDSSGLAHSADIDTAFADVTASLSDREEDHANLQESENYSSKEQFDANPNGLGFFPEVDDNTEYYHVQFIARLDNTTSYPNIESKLGPIKNEQTGRYFRYMVGPYLSKDRAQEARSILRSMGYPNAFIALYQGSVRQ